MTESLPSLYLITDRHQVQNGRQLVEVVEELLQAGVKMVQLREKDLTVAELYPLAKELRTLTRQHKSLLLINDRIDLVQAVGADGVHLGHRSLSINISRQILGPSYLIGASTHSAIEVETAQNQGADFVTYGPIYYTPSKAAYGDPVGIESLQAICHTCKIPVFALGGIKMENVKKTLQTGVHGVAMISALISEQLPTKAYQTLSLEL